MAVADGGKTLAESDLEECCQDVEGETPADVLAAWLALGLGGIECCPSELLDFNVPTNPCLL